MSTKQRKSMVGRAVDHFEREERWARRWRRVAFALACGFSFAGGWIANEAAEEWATKDLGALVGKP